MGFEENLERGAYWEKQVEIFLSNMGYDVEYYICLDENTGKTKSQIIVLDGQEHVHPDFTIELKSNKNNKMLVEVKSYNKFYENYGRLDYNDFPSGNKYATIRFKKFRDYIYLGRTLNIPVRIIFISEEEPDIWRYELAENLFDTMQIAVGTYRQGEKHCLWNIENLKTINPSHH